MTGKFVITCAKALIAAGTILFAFVEICGAVTYQKIALTGDTVSVGSDAVYSQLFGPVINNSGQVAFKSQINGTGISASNNIALWVKNTDSTRLVARSGDGVPGLDEGVVFTNLSPQLPLLNDAGQVGFLGLISGPGVGSNNIGVWSEGSGSLAMIAIKGQDAPGTELETRFNTFDNILFNNHGEIAFRGTLTGTSVNATNRQGIWLGSAESLDMVTRTGTAAPGSGAVFASLDNPLLNNNGQLTFNATLSGPGVNADNDIGIWLGDIHALDLVARTGDLAPGFTDRYFDRIGKPALNDVGQVAFEGGYSTGACCGDTAAIWVGKPNSLIRLVTERDDVDDADNPYLEFIGFNDPLLNSSGKAVFRAQIWGLNSSYEDSRTIWSGTVGALQRVIRSDDPAPGTNAGFDSWIFGQNVTTNGMGQVAFLNFLVGSNITSANDVGIWATDINGELRLIAQEGDLFDVNDDPLIEDLRTISIVGIAGTSGGQDGRSSYLNDNGQLAFWLRFTDGSEGIFVATIPEPGTLGLLGVGAGLVMGRWGKRVA